MMYTVYRRRRRRLNKGRFFTFLLLLALIVAAVVYLIRGGLPWNRDGLVADASPTASDTANQGGDSTPTPEPTPWPTPEPMPEESTDPAVLDVSWQTPAVFDGPNAFPESASLAFGGRIKYWVFQNNKPVENYQPGYEISFGSPDQYTTLEGITAFRGNHYRNSASWGTRDVKEKKLEIVWTHDLGAISAEGSYWPGTGWTGQPLIVHWPERERRLMNIKPEFKDKDLVEVIYPALDGNIYFLDLETGKPTR
ncbi:MAG TPA: pyrrolo-quinoline quinone, partial [Thermoclostridium caenicola]|nr:pyrrolo-quinoline quinone [Thermoclostridium caenicola]